MKIYIAKVTALKDTELLDVAIDAPVEKNPLPNDQCGSWLYRGNNQ